MNKIPYSVATIGLNAHDETVVRSVLRLVEGSTCQKWEYTDNFQADLVLCDPDAALTRIAHKQFLETGTPICVALLKAGQQPAELAHFIHFPLRAHEVIGVLDTAAEEILHPQCKPQLKIVANGQEVPATREIPGDLITPKSLADMLMVLARRQTDNDAVWQINLDKKCIYVFEPEKRFAASTELTPQRLAELASSTNELSLRRVGAMVAKGLRKELSLRPLDELLWNLGINGLKGSLLPVIAQANRIRLLRWPDFGRLGARKTHFGFAALLTRAAHPIEDIETLSGQSAAEVNAFLNACALCNLLEYSHDKDAHGSTYQQHRVKPNRWSGLIKIMRTALGMEIRAA